MLGADEPGQRQIPRAGENGNWQCHECKNVNFPLRSECNRCKAPRLDGGGGGGGGGYGGFNGVMQQLHHNHNHNHNGRGYGSMPNPQATNPAQIQADSVADNLVSFFSHEYDPVDATVQYLLRKHGRNPFGYYIGGGSGGRGGGGFMNGKRNHNRGRNGAPVPGHGGNWQCEEAGCGNINYPYRTNCNRCKRERTAAQAKIANEFLSR